MKRLLFFLAKLIFFSLLLVPLLPWFDLACRFLLVGVTSGTMPTHQMMKAAPYVSSVKLYPFFVLMLATPLLTVRVRFLSIAGGIAIYLLLDLFMVLVWKGMPFQQIANPTYSHIISTNLWDMLGHWLLPFLMWLVIVFGQLEEMRKGRVQEGRQN